MLYKNLFLCHYFSCQGQVAYIQTPGGANQVILIPQGTGVQQGNQQFVLQSAPAPQYNIQPQGGMIGTPPYVVQQTGTVVQPGGTQQYNPQQQGKQVQNEASPSPDHEQFSQ